MRVVGFLVVYRSVRSSSFYLVFVFFFFFFFSSRRRHTRFDCDWSSDVCSSDLSALGETLGLQQRLLYPMIRRSKGNMEQRSEERRVGKECRSRWSPDH